MSPGELVQQFPCCVVFLVFISGVFPKILFADVPTPRSPGSLLLTYSRGPDQGSFATSQSSFAGGVIEYVGGSDILTLFRRVGMPVSVDAIAVEDVPWERSLSTPGLTIGSRGGTGGAGGDSERESKFS